MVPISLHSKPTPHISRYDLKYTAWGSTTNTDRLMKLPFLNFLATHSYFRRSGVGCGRRRLERAKGTWNIFIVMVAILTLLQCSVDTFALLGSFHKLHKRMQLSI